MFKCILVPLVLILSIEGVKGQRELLLRMADSASDLLIAAERHHEEAKVWDSTWRSMFERANAMPNSKEKLLLLMNTRTFQLKAMKLQANAQDELNRAGEILKRAMEKQETKEIQFKKAWNRKPLQLDAYWYSLALSVYPSSQSAGGTERSN